MIELDPRRLLVLAAVADRGGVVAAADALHLTPSAVSQQLVRLEREAGVALVDRSRRQARLTVAGGQLAERGRRIANELLAAGADVAQWTDASGSTVVVAGFSTAIRPLLVPMIEQLSSGHQITVRLVERSGPRAVADLHAGEVDVVLAEVTEAPDGNGNDTSIHIEGEAVPSSRLRTALLLDDGYRIAVPAEWPADDWIDAGAIVDELTRRPWIVSTRRSASRRALERLTTAWRFTPRVAHEGHEFSTVVALVAAGFGAAVVPQLAWAEAVDRTLLLDPDRVAVAAGISADLRSRPIAVLVRDTPRRVPAVELTLAALQRAADAEEIAVVGS
jgi:DNA-binding transcriptional LysR family regulator